MPFLFEEAIDQNFDIKRLRDKKDEILHQDKSDIYDLLILLEEPSSRADQIISFIRDMDYYGDITILSVIPFAVRRKDKSKNVVDFYRSNKIDLKKHIKPNSVVITVGRALYSVTESNDLQVKYFYDYKFNKTHFYSLDYKSWIFPIDALYLWLGNDNFENFFASAQFRLAFDWDTSPIRPSKPKLIEVKDTSKFFKDHMGPMEMSLDIETSSLDSNIGKIGCVTISFDGRTGYYLHWKDIDVEEFNEFLKDKFLILANGKFDAKFLVRNGVELSRVYVNFDTLQAGHLLNEMRSNSLKAHAWLYTYYGGYDQPLDDYKKKYKDCAKNYLKIPFEVMFPYATMDAIVTFQVYLAMKLQMMEIDEKYPNHISPSWTMQRFFYDVRIPYVNMFVDIELDGIYINWDKLKEVSKTLDIMLDDIKKQIFDHFKVDFDYFNLESSQELGLYLEHEARYPCIERANKKVKHYLTNDSILDKWSKLGLKGADLIIKYREISQLQKTFVGHEGKKSGYFQYNKIDERLFPVYAIMLALSLRNKCSGPNLQQSPKRGKYAKLIRSYFSTPDPSEFLFGDVDFSGFQLRIGAIYSSDEKMIEIFTKLSGDMHSITAYDIFCRGENITLEYFLKNKKKSPYKQRRQKSKGANFGLLFGSSGFSFAKSTLEKEWTEEECDTYLKENDIMNKPTALFRLSKENNMMLVDLKFCKYWAVANDIRKKFFETYWGLERWIKQQQKFAKKNGFVRSSFGPVRRLPELTYIGDDSFQTHIKNLCNISLNSPVQTFESSIIAMGMIDIYRELKKRDMKSRIIGMVHDSCMLYIHKSEKNEMKNIIKKAFEKDRPEYNGIPIEVEGDLSDVTKEEYWGFGKFWF